METTTMEAGGARRVEPGRGVEWWTEAWSLFMKNPGMWLVFGLIVLILYIVLNFVPLIGNIVAAVLTPVFMGGWLLAIDKQQRGERLEPADLFLGFKEQLNPLLVLGALLAAGTLVITLIVGFFGFGAVLGAGLGAGMQSAAAMMAGVGLGAVGMLVGVALLVPVMMAIWFAPALVIYRGLQPVDAARLSFAACLRNMMPFLVYGVLGLVASIVATIPAGLGWLVLLPVSFLTLQATYRDIFGA